MTKKMLAILKEKKRINNSNSKFKYNDLEMLKLDYYVEMKKLDK